MNDYTIPTPIIDKNGVQTTRNKRSGAVVPNKRSAGIPVRATDDSPTSDVISNVSSYAYAFSEEYNRRVSAGEGNEEDNKHAKAVQKLASELDDAVLAAESKSDGDPDVMVSSMYDFLNDAFESNKDDVTDEDEISYVKSANREFIIDATLVLSGKEAVLCPDASYL